MKNQKTIGILALQGDVSEHMEITRKAADKLALKINIISVRTKKDAARTDGLIIPGGESTVIHKLMVREGIFEEVKKNNNIMGTCAGAIMLAKSINHKTSDQKTLELMDMEIDRNAYGRQTESFESDIETKFGRITAIFIRAPKINRIGEKITILAKIGCNIVACEETVREKYYMAVCFHPELSSTLFHEHFIRRVAKSRIIGRF